MLVELRRIEREEPIQGEQILPYTWVWNMLMNRLKDYHLIAHS